MIYIVRHGETDWNVEGRYQGRQDTELNEKGRSQAREIKEKLKDVKFDKIISSPLKRAYETAEIIANGFPIEVDSRLIERSNGELEGKLREEIHQIVNYNDPKETRYGIENINDLRARVFDFCKHLEEISEGKNVLVVTHAGVCIYVRCYFEGEPPEMNYRSYRLNNCEVITYEGMKKNERVH